MHLGSKASFQLHLLLCSGERAGETNGPAPREEQQATSWTFGFITQIVPDAIHTHSSRQQGFPAGRRGRKAGWWRHRHSSNTASGHLQPRTGLLVTRAGEVGWGWGFLENAANGRSKPR